MTPSDWADFEAFLISHGYDESLAELPLIKPDRRIDYERWEIKPAQPEDFPPADWHCPFCLDTQEELKSKNTGTYNAGAYVLLHGWTPAYNRGETCGEWLCTDCALRCALKSYKCPFPNCTSLMSARDFLVCNPKGAKPLSIDIHM
jgi:hypothetical protein